MRALRKISATFFALAIVLLVIWNAHSTQNSLVLAYSPIIGHQTDYNYGFINIQPNQTATNIQYWTGLTLVENNYTMYWHQHTNLTIGVTTIAQVGPLLMADYNFSIRIHSNEVTITNNSWQTSIILNASVQQPAPTGITNGTFSHGYFSGLPSFFLDDLTLAALTVGSNVIVGESRWQTIGITSFNIEEEPQLCYQLFNRSITSEEILETTYVIDQDIGMFFWANETRLLSFGTLQQSLTYYYQVLTTNVPLIPSPSLIPLYLIVAVTLIILIIVIILLVRRLWLRRRH